MQEGWHPTAGLRAAVSVGDEPPEPTLHIRSPALPSAKSLVAGLVGGVSLLDAYLLLQCFAHSHEDGKIPRKAAPIPVSASQIPWQWGPSQPSEV